MTSIWQGLKITVCYETVPPRGNPKVMAEFTTQRPGGAVFIGDQISPEAARIFDGNHTYNPTGLTKGKSLEGSGGGSAGVRVPTLGGRHR